MTTFFLWGAVTLFATALGFFWVDTPDRVSVDVIPGEMSSIEFWAFDPSDGAKGNWEELHVELPGEVRERAVVFTTGGRAYIGGREDLLNNALSETSVHLPPTARLNEGI